MEKNAKIYVAGSTGLVGSAIVKRLQEESYTNIITRTRHELDLTDQKAVYEFYEIEKPEYVINSAARVGGIKANMTYPADFLFENLQIQNNIIWGAHAYNVRKLLFLGSSCIYPRNSPQPIKEEYFMDWKVEPTNEGYAIAKITWMKLCEKIFDQYGKQFISCMPTNIYWPWDHFDENSWHVIPALIKRMHEAKVNWINEISIWWTWTNRREFLYVDDLADACIWLMNNYSEKQFLNVWTWEDISIKELAYLIKKIVGYEWNLVFDTNKPDGMPLRRLEVDILNKCWWKYTTSLVNWLEKTYEYFLNIK